MDLLDRAWTATAANPPAGAPPTASAATRAALSGPPDSTTCACAALPDSRHRCCNSFFTRAPHRAPACSDATATGADPATSEDGIQMRGKLPSCSRIQNVLRVRLIVCRYVTNGPGGDASPSTARGDPRPVTPLVAVARRLHPDQRRLPASCAIKPLGIAESLHQLPFPISPVSVSSQDEPVASWDENHIL